MKLRFSGIPFVVYPVSNMARARRFYGGVLGLKAGKSWENLWVEYSVGRQTLALTTLMEGSLPGAKGAALALETDQFAAAVAHLRKRRVKFTFGPESMPTCEFARFTDPDGNPLILHRKH